MTEGTLTSNVLRDREVTDELEPDERRDASTGIKLDIIVFKVHRVTYTDPRPMVIAAYHFVFLSRLSWRRTKTGAIAVTISVQAEIALRM